MNWIYVFGLFVLHSMLIDTCQADIMSDLGKSTAQFAFDMLKAEGNPAKTVFFSPASISTCVGMLYAGSAGQTKLQINNALYSGLTDEAVNEQMKDLAIILNQPSNSYNLSIGNRLYIEENFEILKTYQMTLQTYFQSDVKSVVFSDAVRVEINDWIENKTNHKIKNMIPEGEFDSSTILALVNAIYFKGEWKTQFNESNTSNQPFFTDVNNSTAVDMMIQYGQNYSYTSDNDVQVLGLPYIGEEVTMYILLPNKRFGLSSIETQLTGEKFRRMITNCKETPINIVQIPKFKLEQEFDLTAIFPKLGMTDMFSASLADLSGISSKKGLFVTKAIHKAFIEINEKGAEAAASTVVTVDRCAGGCGIKFIANQPFLFAIVERSSLNPLFVGRFVGQ